MPPSNRLRTSRLGAIALAAIAFALLAAGCSSSGSATGQPAGRGFSLVAYSTPKPAYDAIATSFAKTAAGKGSKVTASYGASGDQARSVIAGLKADYVAFSLQTDMDKLVDKGLVSKSWNAGADKGFITNSVVVFIVRKGNPKHITSWDDLLKSGVKVVTPNPFSSGSARWNILAAYGQAAGATNDRTAGVAYLNKLFPHIVAQPASGRDATSAFTSGTGDVLLSYENEAIFAKQRKQSVDYVVPPATLLIQNPAAVTVKANATAKAFLAYAHSAAGQAIFAQNGYRPVRSGIKTRVEGANDPDHPFPTPKTLLTVDGLGGWKTLTDDFFDPTSGIITKIEIAKGVSVDK